MAPTAPHQQRVSDNTTLLSRSQDGTVYLHLVGDWLAGKMPVAARNITEEYTAAPPTRFAFDASALGQWDSGLLVLIHTIITWCKEQKIPCVINNLPAGMQRLLALTEEPMRGTPQQHPADRSPFLERLADLALIVYQNMVEMTAFLGEATVACGKLFIGRARWRRSDLWLLMQECGAQALPIVSLISLLVGLIFAFVGAVQLTMFGAQIYVASLVGIAIVRIMGAIMTGIIMAGRTGAAFAARIGTMQVNEEIDALITLGINPVEFLVLPRIVALVLMMPLLCLYADLMGILGGLLVGTTMLDLNVMEYIEMTKKAVRLQDFWIGLIHSAVFGVLVALAGCLRGMQCGRNAAAVGHAATSAVVTGIVSIICATAVITVICNILGV